MDIVDECSVCGEIYGEELRPRCLPCGHSYCTDCIQKLIKDDSLSCPTCKSDHNVSDASDIAVNFDLEKSLSLLVKAPFPKNPVTQSSSTIKNMIKLMIHQELEALEQQVLADKTKAELREYDKFLHDSASEHKEIAERLRALAVSHDEWAKKINGERNKIHKKRKEVGSYDTTIKESLESLGGSIAAETYDLASLTKVVENMDNIENWMEACQRQFPDPEFVCSRVV